MRWLGSFSLGQTLCLALALRLAWAFLIPIDPVSDSAAYATFATNIVEHGVYGFVPEEPGAYWAVGTAAIYAGAYAIFGTGSAIGVVFVNMLSSIAVVWLLHHLGRRWFGEAEGRMAALLFAVWPMAIQFTTILASELHFMALTLAALACWDRAGRSFGGVAFVVLSGAFFAGATYVRPIALLIPAALAVATLLHSLKAAPGAVLKAALVTAVIFALVAPWSARNERVLGKPVFISTNFWPNFWMGNHLGTGGGYTELPAETKAMTEIERSEHMKELAVAELYADPAAFLWRTVWKSLKLHERETIGVVWNEAGIKKLVGDQGVTALKLLSTMWWYGVLLLAIAGVVLLVRGQGFVTTLLSPAVWLWGYFTGVHAVIVIGDRYHMPAIPMISLLAAVALVAFGRRSLGSGGKQQTQ